MKHNKLSVPQQVLLEALAEPMSIQDLAGTTKFSVSYVRTQLKILESAGRVERVDNRMPYIYRMPLDSPLMKHKARIQKYKAALIGDIEADNSVILLLQKAPREQWPEIAEELRAIAESIDMLNGEGRLIQTLEGIL